MTNTLERAPTPTGISRYLPFIDTTKHYKKVYLRPDILAGLTAWAMVVPEGIGYASIAGMPAQSALYAAALATLAYFLFGTSHEVTVGPSSALAIMSAATVGALGLSANSDDWIATTSALAILVGVICLIAGILKLGFINNFISKPVLDGFVAGLALNIIIGQVPKLFGFDIDSGLNFWESVAAFFQGLDEINITATIIGIGSLLMLIGLSRISGRIPGALITVAVMVVVVSVLGLEDQIPVIGDIPSGFPVFDVPGVGLETIIALIPGALGIALVAYAETLSGGRTFAAKRRYQIDPNQEFVALGFSNIGAGFFQGFAVNGSLSRTKLKYDAGVKTSYSTLFTSIAIVLTLLFLTWFFENLADAAIAAIVIHAVWSLIRPKMWPRLWKTARMEFWAALLTALVVMTAGEVEGLAIGILIAILIVTAKVSSARVRQLGFSKDHDAYVETDVDEQAALTEGVVIVRPDAEPMFANTSDFHDALMDAVYEAPTTPHCVVIDMVTAADIDVTAGEGLEQVHEELDAIEINLKLARVGAVTQSDLDIQGLTDVIGASNIHGTIREAVTDATSANA